MFLLDEDTLGKCCLLHSANDANTSIITHPSHPTCFPPTPYTAKDLIHTILEKYSVTDSSLVLDYFGIFESLDGHNIGACLNPEDRVVDHVKSWTTGGGNGKATDTAKLVFMIRLFMPCLWGLEHKDQVGHRLDKPAPTISVELYLESAYLRDEALIHLQYIQALYHIITSQYPTNEEQALTLGAYHFIFKFGSYKSDVHKLGFLGTRIVEFIPIKLLRLHDFDEWETKLLEHLKDFTAHDNHEKSVQRLYMEDVFKMAIFGSAFFRCNQKGAHNLPENIILGVQFDVSFLLSPHPELAGTLLTLLFPPPSSSPITLTGNQAV